jgi:hypothetical protein
MSSAMVLFVLVVGYAGIVLWWVACAVRIRQRSLYWRDRLARAFNGQPRAGVLARSRLGSRRYLAGALAGAAVASLIAAAVIVMPDFGSTERVGVEKTLRPRPANPTSLQPSRALATPIAAHAETHEATRTGRKVTAHVRRHSERPTQVVSNLVNVSARVTTATSTASPTQARSSDGPAPLPAPAGSSAPSPLAAP